jgi:hypothetical protein
MTESGFAESTEAAIANLRASGYRVHLGKAARAIAPDWLARFEPDLIAHRGEEFLVVEVKGRRSTAATAGLSELASEVGQHTNWALELVWVGGDRAPASSSEVEGLISRALRVLEVDVEAALLLIWPAVETSLELLASRVGIGEASTRQVMSELYSLGWLAPHHFEELEAAQDLRNQVAHQVGVSAVEETIVLRLAEIARRIAAPDYVPVDQMIEWFRGVFKDPADGVPYNSGEGGYQYINGGPYDALEELSAQFPNALPDELEAAASELEAESYEWVRHDEY